MGHREVPSPPRFCFRVCVRLPGPGCARETPKQSEEFGNETFPWLVEQNCSNRFAPMTKEGDKVLFFFFSNCIILWSWGLFRFFPERVGTALWEISAPPGKMWRIGLAEDQEAMKEQEPRISVLAASSHPQNSLSPEHFAATQSRHEGPPCPGAGTAPGTPWNAGAGMHHPRNSCSRHPAPPG